VLAVAEVFDDVGFGRIDDHVDVLDAGSGELVQQKFTEHADAPLAGARGARRSAGSPCCRGGGVQV
jgi:hypothetical protein